MAIEVFTKIFERIDNVVISTISDGTLNLINTLSPLIQSCFAVYVMFVFWSYWQSSATIGSLMIDFIKRLFAWGVFLSLSMNLDGYNQYVLPLVLNLGDGLAQVFTGYPDSNANVLDALATQLAETVTNNQDEAVSLPMPLGLGQYISVVVKNSLLIICFSLFLVVAAAYIMLAKVFLAILSVVGPIFIALGLFPATRQFTVSWVNQVLNYSLLLLLMSITAGVFITYLNDSLTGGLADTLSNTSIIHLVLATLMMLVVLLKLPELASGLAGGIAANGFSNLASIARGGGRYFSKSGLRGGSKSGGSFSRGKPSPEAKGKQ